MRDFRRFVRLMVGGCIALSSGIAGAQNLPPEQIAQGVLSTMDPQADPCQDFYQYACGTWLRTEVRPADRARWSRSFTVIDERNKTIVRTILEEAAKNSGGDPNRAMVGDFYGSCMDEGAIEEAGATPLAADLAEIAAIDDLTKLFSVAGRLHRRSIQPFLGLGVFPDFKDPEHEILVMLQGGLGLPDRDFYLSEDPTKQGLLAEYEKLVAEMLSLLGDSPEVASANARAIVAFEKELAKTSRARAEMREFDKLYHKIDLAGLVELTPNLPWTTFFQQAGIQQAAIPINVATPEFFQRLAELIPSTPLETLRVYLRWHLVNSAAPALSKRFVDARFAFFNAKLAGQKENPPRWKRCVDATEDALGFVIGKIYVQEHFSGDSKAKADEMIDDIEAAFISSLPALSWMDDATRWRAWQKTQALGNKIGFPEVWLDTSKMAVGRQSYFANLQAAEVFETDRQIKKIGQKADRTEWNMVPQEVNAYYNPLKNEIAFPAGILQPPFFHKDFPAAMNYGGIGVVVGHELSHAFDDKGRKFAPSGELKEWWEPAVAERFEKQADCIRRQYGSYEVQPGVFQDGALTAGENIADNGGLKQAWVAYQAWKKRHGGEAPSVPGLSDDQLFFVSFAQTWCSLSTPEYDRLRATTDSHSHARFRVIGSIVNNPYFGQVFSCPAGAPMNPVEKCTVW